jgi:glycine oxidase
MSVKKVLIIGQGIAGSVLAHVLQEKGADVMVMDGALPGASSLAAAGIINPVTGKRFVKSWRFDEFFPLAKSIYGQMEKKLTVRGLWLDKPIVRLLAGAEEANDWAARCGLTEYDGLVGLAADAGDWQELIQPGFTFGRIEMSARVDFPKLIRAVREQLSAQGQFQEQVVDYQEIITLQQSYDALVFCEGFRAADNPFFPDQPWRLAKGEALLLRFPEAPYLETSTLLKKTITLVPLSNGVFWAGGTYQWHYPDLLPSRQERDYLLHHLKEMIRAPYEILDHVAAVRPTVIHRRPILQQSPEYPKLFIFNGLGTKGALLAPFFATDVAGRILS